MYKNPNKTVHFKDIGLVAYKTAWDYQTTLFEKAVGMKIANRRLEEGQVPTPIPNHLLMCEHPHVYTLGKSGDKQNVLLSEAELQARGAEFYPINRGGDVTYHGPGQVVVYPILDLENFFTDIHRYLRTLEEAVIQALGGFGIDAGRVEGLTGVWIGYQNPPQARKICAMGVKASRWVTMHGLALNVNTDLSYFEHIIPCGINDKQVASMASELGHPIAPEPVKEALMFALGQTFAMDLT